MKRIVEIILFILVLVGLLSIGGCTKEPDFELYEDWQSQYQWDGFIVNATTGNPAVPESNLNIRMEGFKVTDSHILNVANSNNGSIDWGWNIGSTEVQKTGFNDITDEIFYCLNGLSPISANQERYEITRGNCEWDNENAIIKISRWVKPIEGRYWAKFFWDYWVWDKELKKFVWYNTIDPKKEGLD